MKIEGTVQRISPSTNDNKRLSILIDKKWFSLFTEDGSIKFNVGDIIEADYTVKGAFNNIDPSSIKVIGKNIVKEMVDTTSERIEKQAVLKASSIYSQTAIDNIKNAKILYKSLREDWN